MVIGGGGDGFEVKVAAKIDLGTGVTEIVPEIRTGLYCGGICAEEMLGVRINRFLAGAIGIRLEDRLMGD
jgi:hypothetical protein